MSRVGPRDVDLALEPADEIAGPVGDVRRAVRVIGREEQAASRRRTRQVHERHVTRIPEQEVDGADRRRDHPVEPVGRIEVREADFVGRVDRAVAAGAQRIAERVAFVNQLAGHQVVAGVRRDRMTSRQDGHPRAEGAGERCRRILETARLPEEFANVGRIRRAAPRDRQVVAQRVDAQDQDVGCSLARLTGARSWTSTTGTRPRRRRR